MKKLNVAIIGQGRSGRGIHGVSFMSGGQYDKFNLIAVVDPIPKRREIAGLDYGDGVKAFADYKELLTLENLDLIINASMSHQHYPISKFFLEKGYNVLSEKPAAKTAAEVDDLIQTAKANGGRYFVFQQSRFAPYYQKIKEILSSGVLGKIFEIDINYGGFSRRWDWQTIQSFCAGSLYNTGPHPLDQALDLLDTKGEMPNVFAKLANINSYGDAEDYVKLILTYPEKPLIDITISPSDFYHGYMYRIHGSYGSLAATPDFIRWKYYDPKTASTKELIKEPLSNEKGYPTHCADDLVFIGEEHKFDNAGLFDTAKYSLYDMIYDNLTQDIPCTVTPEQVRLQIAVAEECHRQNPLPVKY